MLSGRLNRVSRWIFGNHSPRVGEKGRSIMKKHEVYYEVCRIDHDGTWEPMGFLFPAKADAERELREQKRHCRTGIPRTHHEDEMSANTPPSQRLPNSTALTRSRWALKPEATGYR